MSGLASIALAASMSSSVSFGGRPPVRPSAPRGGKTRLGALADQAALEFRQRAKHVKNQPPLRGRRVEGSPWQDRSGESFRTALQHASTLCRCEAIYHCPSAPKTRSLSHDHPEWGNIGLEVDETCCCFRGGDGDAEYRLNHSSDNS